MLSELSFSYKDTSQCSFSDVYLEGKGWSWEQSEYEQECGKAGEKGK